MTGLSKSKRARRSQYLDLRTRGFRHEEATREVERTDEMIDIARQKT